LYDYLDKKRYFQKSLVALFLMSTQKIEVGFGCGAWSSDLPPEKWAIIETKNKGPIRLDLITPEQVELWVKRGDNYAHPGVSLVTGAAIHVFLTDLP